MQNVGDAILLVDSVICGHHNYIQVTLDTCILRVNKETNNERDDFAVCDCKEGVMCQQDLLLLSPPQWENFL